jgi:serine/threonine-protein kinase
MTTAASSTTLVPGAMLAGKYRVEQQLGEGGMGAVFLAENTDIGRKVAIKVLHADFAQNEQLLTRFRLEARAAAAIGHPGIVDILDMGTTADGSAFIVMERLDGETLGGRLTRVGRLGAAEAARVTADVLEALAAAHAKGIIHRDLKPDNVFLVQRPVAITKVLDFGISKLQGSEDVALTRTGTVMGTPLYMSPEQARGAKDVGPPTDLYSAGAMLYHALTGAPPFTGDTYNEVLAKVLLDEPRPLAEARPGLPASLVRLVDALLHKEAHERPSAREAAALLRQAANEAPSRGDTAALDATMAVADDATAPGRAPSIPQKTPVAAVSADSVPPRAEPTGDSLAPAPAPAPVVAPAAPPAAARSRWPIYAGVGVVLAAGIAVAVLAGGGGGGGDGAAAAGTPDAAAGLASAAPVDAGAVGAPPPARVRVMLVATPPEATWSLDGEPLHCNGCPVERSRGSTHVAVASAPGYADYRVEIVFDGEREERATLLKLGGAMPDAGAAGAARPPRGKDRPPADKPPPPPDDEGKGKGKGGELPLDKTNPFGNGKLEIDKQNPFAPK